MGLKRKCLGFMVSILLLASVVSPSVVLAAVPAAPGGLTGIAVGPTRVDLTWKDNSATETGFRIDRAIDNNFRAGLVSFGVGADVTSLSDVSAATSQAYF